MRPGDPSVMAGLIGVRAQCASILASAGVRADRGTRYRR